MIAMLNAGGVDVNEYYAYEIDKYAILTSQHNFPQIRQCGDVFKGDYTQYKNIDYLIGGSPCTYWSIAQSPDKRETTASGTGWELFSQYVRALHESNPKYFIYENNKSMSKAIYQSISKTFGFEPICINSALVSAQNRQRLYWVGKRNDDNTYSKVYVKQPEDRGIVLKDVLDGVTDRDKSRCVIGSIGRTTEREYFKKNQGNMAAEPVRCFTLPREDGIQTQSKQYRVYSEDGKSTTLCAEGGGMGAKTGLYAIPMKVGEIGNGGQGNRIYSSNGKAVTQQANSGGIGSNTGLYAIPIKENKTVLNGIDKITKKLGYVPQMFNAYNAREIIDKSPTLTTGSMETSSCATNRFEKIDEYAVAIEFENDIPIKAISYADGKNHKVYKVINGQITIKDKTYPIKLVDGFYIIRKLTVSECKRLQTVPEWYEFPVSDTQAYKMLGNGWTCDVITHLIKATL